MQAQKADISSTGNDHYLLVEGPDDWHVHLRLRVANFDIGYCGNDDQVLEMLSAVVIGSGTTKTILGAVLDADADTGVEARLQSIRTRLQSAYNLPDKFPAEGLILHPQPGHRNRNRLPIIGVWLMPDNVQNGIFEDMLCLAMNPQSRAYVANIIDQAQKDGHASFRLVERSKVIVKTHLAWQSPNIKNLGEAIGSDSYFQNLSSACAQFLNWQKRLFSETSAIAE